MTAEAEKLAGLLGARLKALRKEMKHKQSVFARLIGISDDTLGLIERGRKLPRLETLCAIAEQLQMTPGQLLDFKEKPKSDSAGDKELNSLTLYLRPRSPDEIKMVREVARCFFDKAPSIYQKPRRSSGTPSGRKPFMTRDK